MMKKLLPFLCASALALSLTACAGTINNSTADAASDVTFTFTDSGVTAAGETDTGYEIDGTALTITDSGTYTVSGSCADGSIKVKKGTIGVTLVLSDLTLTSEDTAAITCGKSSEVTILVSDGAIPSRTMTTTTPKTKMPKTPSSSARTARPSPSAAMASSPSRPTAKTVSNPARRRTRTAKRCSRSAI